MIWVYDLLERKLKLVGDLVFLCIGMVFHDFMYIFQRVDQRHPMFGEPDVGSEVLTSPQFLTLSGDGRLCRPCMVDQCYR